jgi:mRNA interferase MazF
LIDAAWRDPLVHVRGARQAAPGASSDPSAVIDTLNEIIAVPATRTIRGLATEVILSPDDGMPVGCALNFDHVGVAQRSRLGAVVMTLSESRWPEVETALLIACGFEPRQEPRRD